MDAFSYLSVLISIIVGFAMTEVLKALVGVVQRRAVVRHYWPAIACAVFSLIVDVQFWWASFGLRRETNWTFAGFSLVLLQAVLLYLFAALSLPDTAKGEEVDLRANFFANHRWLFGALLGVLAVSVVKDVVLSGYLPEPLNLAFHGVFAAIALTGIASRREVVHKALVVISLVVIGVYIAALFGQLL